MQDCSDTAHALVEEQLRKHQQREHALMLQVSKLADDNESLLRHRQSLMDRLEEQERLNRKTVQKQEGEIRELEGQLTRNKLLAQVSQCVLERDQFLISQMQLDLALAENEELLKLCKEKDDTIEQLKQQLARVQDDCQFGQMSELMEPVKQDGNLKPTWEWTPWLAKVQSHVLCRDVQGLTKEIGHLRSNYKEAYKRLTSETSLLASRLYRSLNDRSSEQR
ncbi:hypothetical protein EDD86DRAFT_244153 [Gorgonomyces haynaldii]|nr:hypothetical protein EDD86DRAFT_244153 [Gorgonomyces haynaldii]